MNSRELRYFAEIVSAGSISRAAKSLNISQPALTKCVHQLEAELGLVLLNRSANGVAPTPFGESLHLRAMSITSEISRAKSELAALAGAASNLVCVGVLPSQVNRLAPKVSVKLLTSRPLLRLRFVERASRELLSGLLRGEFDLILSVIDPSEVPANVSSHVLFHDRPSMAFRADHPLTRHAPQQLGALAHKLHLYPWILPPEGSQRGVRLWQVLRNAGVARLPAAVLECQSIEFLKATVLQSDCIGFLPNSEPAPEKKDGPLRTIQILQSPHRAVGLLYRNDHPQTNAIRAVIKVFSEVTTSINRGRKVYQ